jgi:AraC-like DNA-binding protein
VEALAAEVRWSRRHLAACFRDELGLPPNALGRLIRVEHAAQRARAGEPLAEVAYRNPLEMRASRLAPGSPPLRTSCERLE